MKVVMELCQRIQTLVFGEVIAEGTPEEIQSNPNVIDAYLGKEMVE
jgi:branched-chain amino acid transport system ATP-binding protein